jgi:hypothetical protein
MLRQSSWNEGTENGDEILRSSQYNGLVIDLKGMSEQTDP